MQTLRLFLEEIEGDWFGWMEAFPGAFSLGPTPQAAAQAAPAAFMKYMDWLRAHDALSPGALQGFSTGGMQIEVVETLRAQHTASGQEINGFFGMDERAVDEEERERALNLLTHARADLRKAVRALPPESLVTAPFGGQSVGSILKHLADTELFWLSCLRLTPRIAAEEDPVKWLETVRREFLREVRSIPASKRGDICTVQGERWSLRKALRRVLGHEQYHTAQIAARSNPSEFLRAMVAERRLWDETPCVRA